MPNPDQQKFAALEAGYQQLRATSEKEITYTGAAVDQGMSMLRMRNADGWYIAIIYPDGSWSALDVPVDQLPFLEELVR